MECFVCEGKGEDYSWKHRDPIEGWKMASKQTCLFCDGKAYILESDLRYPAAVAYTETLKGIELQRKSDKERREAEEAALIKSAKSKLTAEELSALGVDY